MGKITGLMSIDEYGRRQDFNVKILDFRQKDFVQMGFWDSGGVHRLLTDKEQESYMYESIQDRTLRISTKIVRNIIF